MSERDQDAVRLPANHGWRVVFAGLGINGTPELALFRPHTLGNRRRFDA
jgi:hypothetical protein